MAAYEVTVITGLFKNLIPVQTGVPGSHSILYPLKSRTESLFRSALRGREPERADLWLSLGLLPGVQCPAEYNVKRKTSQKIR